MTEMYLFFFLTMALHIFHQSLFPGFIAWFIIDIIPIKYRKGLTVILKIMAETAERKAFREVVIMDEDIYTMF